MPLGAQTGVHDRSLIGPQRRGESGLPSLLKGTPPSTRGGEAALPDGGVFPRVRAELEARSHRYSCYWAQPGYPLEATVENAEERRRRRELFTPAKRWQPRKHPVMQLWASSLRHVRLWDDTAIADELLEVKGEEARHLSNKRRFRAVQGIIELGDHAWAALGAWPWAAFAGGKPPAAWWQCQEARNVLLEAIQAQQAVAQMQADSCAKLRADLGG